MVLTLAWPLPFAPWAHSNQRKARLWWPRGGNVIINILVKNLLSKHYCMTAITHLVPFLHKSLYGAKQGTVTSHRDQDFFQWIDLMAISLPIHLRKGLHQNWVTLTHQETKLVTEQTWWYIFGIRKYLRTKVLFCRQVKMNYKTKDLGRTVNERVNNTLPVRTVNLATDSKTGTIL